MKGEEVTVLHFVADGVDELGAPTGSWITEAIVGDVLVAPASTTDLTGSIRPDGDRVDLTVHMPRTYNAALRGRRMVVRGVTYEVVGAPQAYIAANTPTRWDRPVSLKLVEG